MSLNGLVITLLVFDVYPKITKLDTLSSSIIQYITAMKKTINEVWKYTIFWQINNLFNTCNRLFIVFVHDLPINLLILIYWEGKDGKSEE